MTQPSPYNRAFNFSNYQSSHPADPLPGGSLDEELSRVKAVTDAIRANLALIQRDDTALANRSVGFDQLKTEVQIGINPPSAWQTATNYVARDTVFENSAFYICEESHVSGMFATDLAAGKWSLIASFEAATSAGSVSYDHATSGLAATTVQAAIDEVVSDVNTLSTTVSGFALVASTGDYTDLSNLPALAAVATSGAYADLSGKPTLGTAAAKDVGTAAGTVAAGDDSRITGAAQKTDLASNASGKGAATIGVEDSAGNFTATTVEAVLAELAIKTIEGSAVNLSGATTDIADVPSGVKKIELYFNALSTAANTNPAVRLGTSGGVVSTGYAGAAAGIEANSNVHNPGTLSTGFFLGNDGVNNVDGLMTLYKTGVNAWTASWVVTSEDGKCCYGAGRVSLGDALTKLQVYANASTFDGGTIVPVYYG